MSPFLRRLRADAPPEFLAALGVAAVLAVVLVIDQMHWWQLKPDYAYGWLVPVFVGYVILERWPLIVAGLRSKGESPLAPAWRKGLAVLFGAMMAMGMLFFLLGALVRSGSGVSQPSSFAFAAGYAGIVLGLIYFNVPNGRLGTGPVPAGWRALFVDARLQTAAQFLFPALIWMLSAPLVDAVENQLSLFLQGKVVTVVSFAFNLLGFPLVREGSVLVLPQGQVGVADACSGIRSLTACLFAGSFLAAVFLDKLWKRVALVSAALALAFATNLLRSLFLTAWAYRNGSDSIEGTVHDATGYAVLGLTCVGLLCLLPLFNPDNWLRWLGPVEAQGEAAADETPLR